MTRLGPTIVVLVLFAGTAAAFAVSEHLKLEPLVVQAPRITRTFAPRHGRAEISFRLRNPATISVRIVDGAERIVDTLADDRRVEAGTQRFSWDGAGEPDGVYHVRVAVQGVRTVTIPVPIRLDTKPPTVRVLSVRPPALVRHRSPRVVIRYRLNEQATPLLYVGARRTIVGSRTRRNGQLDWYGTRSGRRLPPGRYRLTLRARDRAGNTTPQGVSFVVDVRP